MSTAAKVLSPFFIFAGKLDTMWWGAWQRLAIRHQGEKWPLEIVTAAGRCFLSHGHKHRNSQCENQNLQFTEPNIFFLQNSPDLSTVNLPSGVIFSRRSTIIKVSRSQWWQSEESNCQQHVTTAWRSHCHFIALSPFYLRLMLFARWRHYFPRLIQINYGMMFRMKRSWFLPNLVKISSIFLKL